MNIHWLWLPLIWGLEILFVMGLALAFSAINVYVRDTRYVIESTNSVLFWLVPVFYSFALIPVRFRGVYQINPVAALVLMMRNVLLEGHAPLGSTLIRLAIVSFGMFGVGVVRVREIEGWLLRALVDRHADRISERFQVVSPQHGTPIIADAHRALVRQSAQRALLRTAERFVPIGTTARAWPSSAPTAQERARC